MDISDRLFFTNRDWDPCYLHTIVSEDFFEFKELWETNVCDKELVQVADKVDHYCPIVEDISLDDETLCRAVEQIEKE